MELQIGAPPRDYNGNLFAIGTKRNFPYFEHTTDGMSTQFLIVEIVGYSVSITSASVKEFLSFNDLSEVIFDIPFKVYLTLKTDDTTMIQELTLQNAAPYNIGDGFWHSIKGNPDDSQMASLKIISSLI